MKNNKKKVMKKAPMSEEEEKLIDEILIRRFGSKMTITSSEENVEKDKNKDKKEDATIERLKKDEGPFPEPPPGVDYLEWIFREEKDTKKT